MKMSLSSEINWLKEYMLANDNVIIQLTLNYIFLISEYLSPYQGFCWSEK